MEEQVRTKGYSLLAVDHLLFDSVIVPVAAFPVFVFFIPAFVFAVVMPGVPVVIIAFVAVAVTAVDVIDLAPTVFFQLADHFILFRSAQVPVVADRINLCIILAVNLVNLVLPVIAITAVVGIIRIAVAVIAAKDHIPVPVTVAAIVFGAAENNVAGFLP